jgi:predicted transcriptional regulator of viral defense system
MQIKYSHIPLPGIGQEERHALDTMAKLGKLAIRAHDLEQQLGYSREKANLMLSRLFNKGWLQRLKSGVYRVIPPGADAKAPPEDAWAIAMELFSPCYISGWTAAEHWELTEQIFNSTIVFTTQKQRRKKIEIAGLTYITKFINAKDIFGTQKLWSSNTPILIADIHRTIIDILDDPQIGGSGRHVIDILKTYLRNKNVNLSTLWQYAEKLNSGAVFKRLGFIVDILVKPSPEWLDKIQTQTKSGVIKLDPSGSNVGPINTKWGIRINIPLEDIT